MKMTVCKIFYLFVLWLNFSTALQYKELNCNFSKYILNYFKHNEKYLLKLKEDKTIISYRDLKTYGRAIQSHGEIVIAMLEALRSIEWGNYPEILMDINLYLNNVSGSVELNFKNKNGTFDQSDKKLNLLEGFLMMHKAIVERLAYYISSICSDVSFDEVFTNCPEFNEKKDYRIKFLPGVVEKLKNRLSINDDLRLKDERFKLEHSEVFRILELALDNDSRWDFHPKKLLYYDMMMGQQEIDERNLMSGVQHRKYSEIRDQRPVNVIDYIRFAPLQYKCPNETYLTLSDIFRYIKYNFDSKQLEGFQELVLATTFRLTLLLVRIYVTFFRKFRGYYKCKKDNIGNNILDQINVNIIETCAIIIKQIQYFNNLNLFELKPKNFLDDLCIDLQNFIAHDISHNLFHNMVKKITTFSKSFLDHNILHNYCGIIVSVILNDDNVEQIYNAFAQLVNDNSKYLIELEKYKESFNIVNKTRKIHFLYFVLTSKEILNPKSAMINRLCSSNIYTEIYNMESPEPDDYKNTRIYIQNQQNRQDAQVSLKHIPLPKYMIDYILFF
ncbi:uncharacterized protein LOC126894861 [Daktulosphaira vitifoliae]|uniref:uncharacterized protein LOC126894861 n=1 Tax=Daktulosphaira vitifoliae TaxID=58002 RepID=UPI0021AAB4BA|nr:uncharacterized protein LOC126894861 [Daktulosphaira vitifoliae]